MSDRQIVTPYCFSKGWQPDEDFPAWATPSKEECTTPPTIREVGIERVLNRRVTAASCHLGTYGMGGAGLVGVGLDGDSEEFLVLCVWGAASWLHWDGKIIDDNNTFGKNWGKPSATQQGHKKFEEEIAGTTLLAFELEDTHCQLVFDSHTLAFDPDRSEKSTKI